MRDVTENACDSTGICKPHPDHRLVSNCIHCGKELVERPIGLWVTWDADLHQRWNDEKRRNPNA